MPQLEDGYLRIANELFDAILGFGFSKRQLTVLLAIVRKTYGYGKKTDDMTVQQLANLTSMQRPHVSLALSELVDIGAVLKRDGKYGYVLGIQKNYGEWHRTKTVRVPKQYGGRTKTVRSPYQNGTHKRQSQKTIPKEWPSVAAEAAPCATFPLKDGSEWHPTAAKLAEWRSAYPGTEAELSKAAQWLRDNPTKRKTERGMPRFLGAWLSRATPIQARTVIDLEALR